MKKIMDESLKPGEKVRVCIEGGIGEALVATDHRLLVLKAGIMAGAYKGPLCFSYDYEDIYMFKWQIRRALEVIPYRVANKRVAIITFTPFQDERFAGAVNFMAKKVIEVRKKKEEKGEGAAQPVVVEETDSQTK